MRVIVAGSRDITDYVLIASTIRDSKIPVTELVCGMARGVDLVAKQWAEDNNIPVREFPADWDEFPMGAGHRRNIMMANYAQALIAVWDGKSGGTKHMINAAKNRGLRVYVFDQSVPTLTKFFKTPEPESTPSHESSQSHVA